MHRSPEISSCSSLAQVAPSPQSRGRWRLRSSDVIERLGRAEDFGYSTGRRRRNRRRSHWRGRWIGELAVERKLRVVFGMVAQMKRMQQFVPSTMSGRSMGRKWRSHLKCISF
jgi:hypothetical protein